MADLYVLSIAGKIKDMLSRRSLDATVLVLVNAVYFRGQWDKRFDKKYTVEEKFWLNKVL